MMKKLTSTMFGRRDVYAMFPLTLTVTTLITLYYLIMHQIDHDGAIANGFIVVVLWIGVFVTVPLSFLLEKRAYRDTPSKTITLMWRSLLVVSSIGAMHLVYWLGEQGDTSIDLYILVLIVTSWILMFLTRGVTQPTHGAHRHEARDILDRQMIMHHIMGIAVGCITAFLAALALLGVLGAVKALFGIELISDISKYELIFAVTFGLLMPHIAFSYISQHIRTHTAGSGNLISPIIQKICVWIIYPIALLYLVILYAYGISVVLDTYQITQILPTDAASPGFTSAMLVLAGLGLATWFILLPLRYGSDTHSRTHNAPGSTRYKRAMHILFIGMIPLIGVYRRAIGYRISLYGLTLNRYYIVLVGVFLLFLITLWFSKTKKMIQYLGWGIIVLCGVTLLPFVGVRHMSYLSQMSLVRAEVAKYDGFDDNGMFTSVTTGDSFSECDFQTLHSSVDYLVDTFGTHVFDEYVDMPISIEPKELGTAKAHIYQTLQIPDYIDKRGCNNTSYATDGSDEVVIIDNIRKYTSSGKRDYGGGDTSIPHQASFIAKSIKGYEQIAEIRMYESLHEGEVVDGQVVLPDERGYTTIVLQTTPESSITLSAQPIIDALRATETSAIKIMEYETYFSHALSSYDSPLHKKRGYPKFTLPQDREVVTYQTTLYNVSIYLERAIIDTTTNKLIMLQGEIMLARRTDA